MVEQVLDTVWKFWPVRGYVWKSDPFPNLTLFVNFDQLLVKFENMDQGSLFRSRNFKLFGKLYQLYGPLAVLFDNVVFCFLCMKTWSIAFGGRGSKKRPILNFRSMHSQILPFLEILISSGGDTKIWTEMAPEFYTVWKFLPAPRKVRIQ